MSRELGSDRLQVPATLESQLRDYRRCVWTKKMVEAAAVAVAAILLAYLAVFISDRLWDTPSWARLGALAGAAAVCTIVPLFLYKWVWQRRRLDQLARLLSHKLPRVGDQLLGVIELAESDAEQSRSRTLCQAAIEHVAADARHRDFRAAAPEGRPRAWSVAAGAAAVVAIALLVRFPPAASNAWARFLGPFDNIPRYTFAAVEPLADEIIVAHGEPFSLAARLAADSQWRPKEAELQLGSQAPMKAPLTDGAYAFTGQPLLEPITAQITVGDWRETVRIVPKLRPELTALDADVQLPEYLGQPAPLKRDVRGGGLSLVQGSRVAFTAAINRSLAGATVDGKTATPAGNKLVTGEYEIAGPRNVELQWLDQFQPGEQRAVHDFPRGRGRRRPQCGVRRHAAAPHRAGFRAARVPCCGSRRFWRSAGRHRVEGRWRSACRTSRAGRADPCGRRSRSGRAQCAGGVHAPPR